MVFQSYALYPHMTVRGNMRFGLEESTDLGDEITERVTETAKLLDIADLLDRKPEALSGGQQQRVALGRAIVREPKAFLMDEPLSNLDAKLRSQMRTELQQLQDDLNTTTVYVTHDQTEAMTMGDRIAILDDGTLQQVATPLEAYHRPANQFVAGFIGEPSMNFVNCAVEGDTLTDGQFRYQLADETAEAVANSTQVTLGIRPEDIVVDAGANSLSTASNHAFPASINVVEPTGDESVVYLTIADGPDVVATVDGFRRVESGIDVAIRLPEDAIHLFDAESGDAVHSRLLDETDIVESRV
jgi:carbohydrate ABC transporter ATP-binding protein, CUT1 family (TC 3.A.1.1.-)